MGFDYVFEYILLQFWNWEEKNVFGNTCHPMAKNFIFQFQIGHIIKFTCEPAKNFLYLQRGTSTSLYEINLIVFSQVG